jgi:hypothetical protein
MNTLQAIQTRPDLAALYWGERSAFDAAYIAAQRVRELPDDASLKMRRETRSWAALKRVQWLRAKAAFQVRRAGTP